MTQGKNAKLNDSKHVKDHFTCSGAEIGDVMDALEVGGGDRVRASSASNAAYCTHMSFRTILAPMINILYIHACIT